MSPLAWCRLIKAWANSAGCCWHFIITHISNAISNAIVCVFSRRRWKNLCFAVERKLRLQVVLYAIIWRVHFHSIRFVAFAVATSIMWKLFGHKCFYSNSSKCQWLISLGCLFTGTTHQIVLLSFISTSAALCYASAKPSSSGGKSQSVTMPFLARLYLKFQMNAQHTSLYYFNETDIAWNSWGIRSHKTQTNSQEVFHFGAFYDIHYILLIFY